MEKLSFNGDFEGYKAEQQPSPLPTKERLARVCESNGLPVMAEKARRGEYDDFESESATPCHDLVRDFMQAECLRLANRAKEGEWDGTKDESEAWFEREGKSLLEGE